MGDEADAAMQQRVTGELHLAMIYAAELQVMLARHLGTPARELFLADAAMFLEKVSQCLARIKTELKETDQ